MEIATRAGWWVAIQNDSKKQAVMEVRQCGKGKLLYGRLPTDGNLWHVAHMFNGRVFGPFKTRKAANAAMTVHNKGK